MNDGGQAFPCFRGEQNYGNSGMSLRDWFAGQALVGLLSDQQTIHSMALIVGARKVKSEAAEIAYAYADAMLAEREKGATP